MKEFALEDKFDLAKARIDYARELNPEQLDVVLHGEGPCLVLAGAGSGKTRTITYRVAYLLERRVAPEELLLLTFTNKAAKEMIERVEGLLDRITTPSPSFKRRGAGAVCSGTFHSVANRLLRRYAACVGHTSNFTILDQEDAKALIKACVKALGVDTTARRFPSPSNLHSIVSYAQNAAMPIRQVVEERHEGFYELVPTIERIAQLYAQRKAQADSLDFDDLLLKLRELLYAHEDIRQRLATQFQYILVDEFQDTNVVQADIVRQLASVHDNVLVVGDDAQSIYSFRAAQVRNILRFPETYPGARVFRLTTNYRSAPEILAVANASIRGNKDQFEKELRAVRGAGERPSLVPAGSGAQEAQYIAAQLLALREEGIGLGEMAVLFRAAFHSQALEFELMKHDIPYEYRGGLKFFERAHVKDVIAHLRVRQNVRDETAWMRVLGLAQGVGLASAEKVMAQLRDVEALDEALARELHVPKRAHEGWQALSATLRELVQEERPSELIRAVLAGAYRDYVEAEYPDHHDRLDDLEQFALFAQGYTSLKEFLDEVSLTTDYGGVRQQGGGQEERVVLSTIHQAKGLEWDAVFVMHLVDGKFPIGAALAEDGGLQEERRLFYVATTRARKRLFFTYPIVSGYDTLELNQPSMFLQELPQALLETVKLKSSPLARPSSWDEDEPTIVLDRHGERTKTGVAPKSFLRSIEEL